MVPKRGSHKWFSQGVEVIRMVVSKGKLFPAGNAIARNYMRMGMTAHYYCGTCPEGTGPVTATLLIKREDIRPQFRDPGYTGSQVRDAPSVNPRVTVYLAPGALMKLDLNWRGRRRKFECAY